MGILAVLCVLRGLLKKERDDVDHIIFLGGRFVFLNKVVDLSLDLPACFFEHFLQLAIREDADTLLGLILAENVSSLIFQKVVVLAPEHADLMIEIMARAHYSGEAIRKL